MMSSLVRQQFDSVIPFLRQAHRHNALHSLYIIVGSRHDLVSECARIFLEDLGMVVNERFENHPDVVRLGVEFDEEDQVTFKTVSVDEVRYIKQRFSGYATHAQGFRVVVIARARDITVQAANALLKLLEEPGERMIFFIGAQSEDELLPTVRSRAHVLYQSQLGSSLDFDSEEVRLCEEFFYSNDAQKWALLEAWFGKKKRVMSPDTLLSVWLAVLRMCWLHVRGVSNAQHNLPTSWFALAQQLGEKRLRALIELLFKTRAQLQHNVQPRLLFEKFIIE